MPQATAGIDRPSVRVTPPPARRRPLGVMLVGALAGLCLVQVAGGDPFAHGLKDVDAQHRRQRDPYCSGAVPASASRQSL